jgi:maltose alpha-D-glucosyltransferase / alpha-amylase
MNFDPTTSMVTATSPTVTDDGALWYKDALIYQLHVRAFADSDGDGVGDFRGLTERLDYIQDLGVTAVWLLPFYPSPLKDDGYDIANYTSVNPHYGTMRDFKAFLREAHRRELRVITELVLNHTSDQHPWFQRARRAKPGEKWRDFYVWSDDPKRYKETRIIFQDFESSNWSWDPVAGAYFWHRFYSHQPDLNFENPEVRETMFQVLDFWLEMGIDGLRLDAVPYLYEREGTNCENLPETHDYLKDLRRHVDSKYKNRMLLAEANQWPEDAVNYFGDGDECHMNFHFPLMPRLFMATQREDRFPIIDIMQQTPTLPENCQWAIFLRNHDELTLEMVTDEERDYMYRAYADDPQARINLGIRRRLAPLLKNNRRKLELMNGLLFSLPGTPIIYYGDEIGMGDNIYLGDRDSVRTPMQWSPDRNAGFSRANPQKLFLPVIIDSEYHYATRNVETDQNSPHSLLWWMKRLIALRNQSHVFGRGTLEFLTPENAKVLVYLRQYEDDTVLVVANLSRFVQYAELDLSRFRGMVPIEMFGQTKFPPIGELPYFLTLGPHSFYWLKLELREGAEALLPHGPLPISRIKGDWLNVFRGKARSKLESSLPRFMKAHRWFGGKARTIQGAAILEVISVSGGGADLPLRLVLIEISYVDGEPEIYQLPLGFASGDRAEQILADSPGAVVMSLHLSDSNDKGILYEATSEPAFWTHLLDAVGRRRTLKGDPGEVTAFHTKAFRRLRGPEGNGPLEPSIHGGQQSNTSAIFGDRLILKLFRRVSEGQNPDLEISQFLTEQVSLAHVPDLAGALEYRAGRQTPRTLAVLHEYLVNEGDAWEYTLDELGRYVERVVSESSDVRLDSRALPTVSLLDLAKQEPPEVAQQMIGPYLQSAELLGKRTAELHSALAASSDDLGFTPEPFTQLYQRGLYQSMRTQARKVFQLLRKQLPTLPESLQSGATHVLELETELLERFRALIDQKIAAMRIRCHGDYHLGQVLFTGKDFVIIDFEGEPERPISERRIKRSSLRDVAGMIRSFHYASNAALMGHAPGLIIHSEGLDSVERWVHLWYVWSSAAFLRAYLETAGDAPFLPQSEAEMHTLLSTHMLEKMVYELGYELNNRPDWAVIPLQGILQLAETES